MDLIVVCVLFLNLFVTGLYLQTTVKSDLIFQYGDGTCWLYDVTFGSSFDGMKNCKDLTLESVNVTETTQELFDNIANGLDTLRIIRSCMDLVYLPSNLSNLHFEGTLGCPTHIIIDKSANYKLQELSVNKLRRHPANVDKLRSLKRLNYSRVRGGTIDLIAFSKMIQLEEINIFAIAGVIVNDSLQLESLRKLTIRNSMVLFFNETLCKLPKLETLHLEVNNLLLFPQYFCTCTNLKNFTISGNEFRVVSFDAFANMNNLEALALSNNNILKITTQNTVELPRLKTLFLDYNRLTKLNVSLWILPALEFLSLRYNRLKQMPGLPALVTRKLQTLIMLDNLWNREWLNVTVQQIPGSVRILTSNGGFW